jgi:MoxR-like ATPase
LKRRCLYHWIEAPAPAAMARIVRRRVPGATTSVVEQATAAVARLRTLDLQKPPGIAEAIDWAAALTVLGVARLDGETAAMTLGSVLKYREDQQLARDRDLAWVAGG